MRGRILHLPSDTAAPRASAAIDARALRERGIHLETMEKPPSAAALGLAAPDGILLEVSGEEPLLTIKTLTSSPESRDIPLVALIDAPPGEAEDLAARARDAGAWQVLRAPVAPEMLAACLETWVFRRRALDRAERDQALLERIYLGLLDRFSDGLFAVQNGLIVYASPAFESLTGILRRDLVDTPIDALFDEPLPRAMPAGDEGSPVVVFLERRLRRKDGRELRLELGASAIEFRKLSAVQFAVRDVSFRRTLEEELLRANAELHHRHRELHEANEKLRAIFKQRTEFLNMVTHELRTSTTVISGYNRMLLGGSVGSLNEQQRAFLEETRKSCDRLSSFLNNLLDIARMDAGRMELDAREHRLTDVVANVLGQLKPMLEERTLRVESRFAPGLDSAIFDREKIEQVLINLLGNAIKFTTPGGSITLRADRVQAGEGEAPSLQISVTDTGMGIPEGDVDLIFDEFSQGARRSGGHKGTGLGLAICRRIVEAHNGRIWATSRLQAGSTFTLRLPQRQARSTAPLSASVPASRGTPVR